MDRLLMIEGIPGSGKTTFAKMLAERISLGGNAAAVYAEGDLHPADMAWCALLTEKEFAEICGKHPDKKTALEANSTRWEEYYVVAYTKIPQLDGGAFGYFESKEVYDGRVDEKLFRGVHQSRWESFGKTASGITVFECAFLQNAVNELLLFHDADENALTEYLSALARAVERLKPTVIYLDADIDRALDNAAAERVDGSGARVWEERVSEYICASPYGVKRGLSGVEGMHRYFAERKELELKVLGRLPVEKIIVKVDMDNRAESVSESVGEIAALAVK